MYLLLWQRISLIIPDKSQILEQVPDIRARKEAYTQIPTIIFER